MNGGAPRKLAIGLAISLALNLFLLGALSVGLLHARFSAHADGHPGGHPEGRATGHPVGPHMLFHAGEAFGRDRPRVMRILREHKAELRSRWRETRNARERVESALRAEPFDRDGLARELENLRGETQRSQEVLHRALVEVAVEATPEQRRHLASWADDHRRRHRTPRRPPSGPHSVPPPPVVPAPPAAPDPPPPGAAETHPE